MTTDPAPYVHGIVPACPRPHTTWLRTDDAARLRSAHWSGGPRGTLVVFNGRTEYIEKYAFLAKPLMQHGYTVAMHDWRGHGLSDRLHKDPDLCHVETFASYQADVDAVLAELECRAAPRPYHLIAHSMGGCIGLRTLHRTDAFRSAVVLAPMWGFYLDRIIGGVALALSTCATLTGFGGSFVHGTSRQSYLQAAGIDRNVLTSCTETFLDLRHQIEACPRLSLGGPSWAWLRAALRETASLRCLAPPVVDALVFLGTDERVIDPEAIKSLMAVWPRGELRIVPGCKHELLMEGNAVRQDLIAQILDFINERT